MMTGLSSSTLSAVLKIGHTVIEASSGAQALELIRGTPRVDLVMTDQAMPQMTGIQLIAAIKVEWPDLPVLLVSGYAELPSNTGLIIPKLAKPFSLDDLEEAVANSVAGKVGADKFNSSYLKPLPSQL